MFSFIYLYSLLVSSGGTGINDAVNTHDFVKIYPNPSPGKFTVSARTNFNSIRQMDESFPSRVRPLADRNLQYAWRKSVPVGWNIR